MNLVLCFLFLLFFLTKNENNDIFNIYIYNFCVKWVYMSHDGLGILLLYAPQGSGHSPTLPELKKHLDNTLSHMV